jgi:hypothetical protein
VLTESGVVRSDIRSSFGDYSGTAEGVPMTLELVIRDLAHGGKAFAGVAVYVWHCDAQGRYSLYSDDVTDQNYLRGVQIADEQGKVKFTSIFPRCYSGRWPHIHFEVYPDQASITDSTSALATSQVALPQDASEAVYAEDGYEDSPGNLARLNLSSDNVFGEDSGALQLRVAEMCSLRVESLSQDGGYDGLQFIGKGGKPADIPLPVPVMRAVRVAVDDRTTGPLLRNRAGKALTTLDARRMVNRIAKVAGCRHIAPHGLRRTFCTAGLVSGVPMRDRRSGRR